MEIKIPPIDVPTVPTDVPTPEAVVTEPTDLPPYPGYDGTQTVGGRDGTEETEVRPDILAPESRRPAEAAASEHGGAAAVDSTVDMDTADTGTTNTEYGFDTEANGFDAATDTASDTTRQETSHDDARYGDEWGGDDWAGDYGSEGQDAHKETNSEGSRQGHEGTEDEDYGQEYDDTPPSSSSFRRIVIDSKTFRELPRDEWIAAQRAHLRELGVPESEWPEELREQKQEQPAEDKPAAAADDAAGQAEEAKRAEQEQKDEKPEADTPKAAAEETPPEKPEPEPEKPEPAAAETPAGETTADKPAAEQEAPEPATAGGDGGNIDPPDETPPTGGGEFGGDIPDDKNDGTTDGHVEIAAARAAAAETPADEVTDPDEAAKIAEFASMVGDGDEAKDEEGGEDADEGPEEPPELREMLRPTLQPGVVAVKSVTDPETGWENRGAVAPTDAPATDRPGYTPTDWNGAEQGDPRTEVEVPSDSVAVGQASEDQPVTLTASSDGSVVTAVWSADSQTGAVANVSEAGDVRAETAQALRDAVDAAPELATDSVQATVVGQATQPGQGEAAEGTGVSPTAAAMGAVRDVLSAGGSPTRDVEMISGEHDGTEGADVRLDVATGRVTGPTGEAVPGTGAIESDDTGSSDTGADTAGDDGGADE